jgi:hypothetical protein
MKYFQELIQYYHPDKNENKRYAQVITRVIIKLRKENNDKAIRNLYERLLPVEY